MNVWIPARGRDIHLVSGSGQMTRTFLLLSLVGLTVFSCRMRQTFIWNVRQLTRRAIEIFPLLFDIIYRFDSANGRKRISVEKRRYPARRQFENFNNSSSRWLPNRTV